MDIEKIQELLVSENLNKRNAKAKELQKFAEKHNLYFGFVELAWDGIKPKRNKKTILKEIERVEMQMYERSKKGRLQGGSAGAFSRDMQNISIKLKNLKIELKECEL